MATSEADPPQRGVRCQDEQAASIRLMPHPPEESPIRRQDDELEFPARGQRVGRLPGSHQQAQARRPVVRDPELGGRRMRAMLEVGPRVTKRPCVCQPE